MRKIFTSVIALFTLGSVCAQNLPDGSFENWIEGSSSEGVPYLTYENDVLRCLNSLYEIPADPFPCELTAFRETDCVDGLYAIKLVTTWFGTNAILVPGALATLSEDYVSEYLENQTIETKQQHSFKPWKVTGYYKYAPVNGDSAVIALDFYRNNTVISTCAPFKITAAQPAWTPFEIVTGLENQAMGVTHVSMIFASSAKYDFRNLEECQGQAGSSLYLDNLQFHYETGLVEPIMHVVKTNVYPNPSADNVRFDLNKEVNGRLVVYSIEGNEISARNFAGNHVDYNVSDLSDGIYLYRIIDGNTVLSSGRFVVGK